MDRWDLLIIGIAAYTAVMSLVRMMAARRNELVKHVREQVQQEMKRKKAAAERKKKEAAA